MSDFMWGVIGCGEIARKFASSLAVLDSGLLWAAASKSAERAAEYADAYDIKHAYTDYIALVNDPDVHAVYVATTHNFHYENVKLCLENGKHVLCEKPITVNATQFQELSDLAHKNGLFLMEGLWSRFLPAIQRLQELVAEGAVGDVRSVQVDFCLAMDVDDSHRLKNTELGGGALLDLGIYPINFAALIFGEHPQKVSSSAVMGKTGVDESSFYTFEYSGGRRAILSASFREAAPVTAVVRGSHGYIMVPNFLGATELRIKRNNEELESEWYLCQKDEGFKYEIAHVMECIEAGKMESDIMPHSETLAILKVMDGMRAEWGLHYPNE